jgi:hypothetical protein
MDGSSKYFVEALKKLKSKSKMPKEYLCGERSYFIHR